MSAALLVTDLKILSLERNKVKHWSKFWGAAGILPILKVNCYISHPNCLSFRIWTIFGDVVSPKIFYCITLIFIISITSICWEERELYITFAVITFVASGDCSISNKGFSRSKLNLKKYEPGTIYFGLWVF